ncbi:hypothetical protein [Aquimarina hainanensis]
MKHFQLFNNYCFLITFSQEVNKAAMHMMAGNNMVEDFKNVVFAVN